MGIFRRRPDLRPLDEQECYARLHGARTGDVVVASAPEPAEPAEPAEFVQERLGGPTDDAPAVHLVISYPRNAGRITGEQVREELLRRMASRAGEAA